MVQISFCEHFCFLSTTVQVWTQWKAVRTCLLVMRDPPHRQESPSPLCGQHIRTILRFAQSYNPEIGLHNPKYRAVHLDNPEGKRQLLWRSLFEARTWFLILRILKGRNHSNLLCRLSQVKNKLGSMWPFFGQQMDLLGKLSTKNKSRSYGHCPHLP